MRENVPASLESFMFPYQSPHNPADMAGMYLPNYYALALVRLGQAAAIPPAISILR